MKRKDCIKCRREESASPTVFESRVADDCLHNRFVYVYYKRKRGSQEVYPYYVGKGSIRRVFSSHDNVKLPRQVRNIRIFGRNMSDADARQAEMLLIHIFGRKSNKTGTLVNLSPGGDGRESFHVTRSLRGDRYTSILSDERFYEANPDFFLLTTTGGGWVANKFPRLLISGRWRARKEAA